MLCKRENLNGLSLELLNELNYFKDELESDNPFGGKIQLNPIPACVKAMILNDSDVIKRIKSETYVLESDKRVWTFPKFTPPVAQQEAAINQTEIPFPDPKYYCIGVYL